MNQQVKPPLGLVPRCCTTGGVAEEEPLSPEEERASDERYALSVSLERLQRNLEKRRQEGRNNGSV